MLWQMLAHCTFQAWIPGNQNHTRNESLWVNLHLMRYLFIAFDKVRMASNIIINKSLFLRHLLKRKKNNSLWLLLYITSNISWVCFVAVQWIRRQNDNAWWMERETIMACAETYLNSPLMTKKSHKRILCQRRQSLVHHLSFNRQDW
jgi:hypothetical protein